LTGDLRLGLGALMVLIALAFIILQGVNVEIPARKNGRPVEGCET